MHVFIGHDTREQVAYDAAKHSIAKYNADLQISGIYLNVCKSSGLYYRPTATKNGHLFDIFSNAPMATEFALTRFLVPWLAPKNCKWALFMDCDIIARCDLMDVMKLADPKYAVMCVKHDVEHGVGKKMDDCKQTSYKRKNWSSVVLWNLEHPANKRLTLREVNTVKGLHLHQFFWLKDHEIGELPNEWNHLVGLLPCNKDAKIVHYTLGTPNLIGYENCEHSNEWFKHYTDS